MSVPLTARWGKGVRYGQYHDPLHNHRHEGLSYRTGYGNNKQETVGIYEYVLTTVQQTIGRVQSSPAGNHATRVATGFPRCRNIFVHGKHEITSNGVKPAPIGDKQIAKKLAPAFTPKFNGDEMSSLEQWNYCLHNMYHSKAAVPNQLIICTALGAPFASRYALSNNCGGVISLASTASGRGKTYTCMTALRAWANPNDLTFASKSGVTINALMTNLGYANSLPILRDR